MPSRPEKLDFFLELARTAVAVDDDAGEQRALRERRAACLDATRCAITPEDRLDIIRDALRPTQALRTTQAWTASVVRPRPGAPPPEAFLVLIGERGRGKTVACAYVAANELCRFITGPELSLLHVRARFDKRAAEELLQVHAAGLLILDDLCRDNCPPKEEADAMYNLLQARTTRGYHTLVTTNLGLSGLRERLGDYVADRFEHAGLIVKLTGPNLRRTSDPEPPGPRLVRGGKGN